MTDTVPLGNVHEHDWGSFEQGWGCHLCSAWVGHPRRVEHVDPLPTSTITLTYLDAGTGRHRSLT